MKKVYLVKIKDYDSDYDSYISEVVTTKRLAERFQEYLKIIYEGQNKIVWITEEPVDDEISLNRMNEFMKLHFRRVTE